METNSNNEEEVKEFQETVTVEPTKDEELVEETENETPSSSSDEEKEPEQENEEETPEPEPEPEPEQEADTPEIKPEPKPVEGETPREKALRLEATRLKGLLREQRRDELFVKQPTTQSPKDEELAGYDPEELKRFETVATKLGFARKDEILHQTTQDRLNSEFETFIEGHPEYSPESDKDGVLWNQFKSEFSLYNPPRDPKTLRKVLNKVHNEIYGVQPAKNLSKINASQEKIKVASHTGASAGKTQKTPTQQPSGLRTDMLKGFDEKDIQELLG